MSAHLRNCEVGGHGSVLYLDVVDGSDVPTNITSLATTNPTTFLPLVTPGGSTASVPLGATPRSVAALVDRSSYAGTNTAESHGDGTPINTDWIGVIDGKAHYTANGYPVTGATTLTDGTSYYLTGTFDGVATVKVYVEGALDGTFTSSFDPTQLSGLTCWLDGQHYTGTTSAVSQLNDRSTSGNNWDDGTVAAFDPVINGTGLNALPITVFDGTTNRRLQNTAISIPGSSGFTLWTVFQWVADTGTNQVVLDVQSGRFLVFFYGGTGNLGLLNGGGAYDTGWAPAGGAGAWVVLRFEVDPTLEVVRVYNKGTLVYTSASMGATLPWGGSAMLNSVYTGGGFGVATLSLAEFILAEGLQTRASSCDAYLQSRWGL